MQNATQPQKEEEFTGITVKMGELVNCQGELTQLFSKPLKKESAFRIKPIMKQLNAVFMEFEKNRIALCASYAPINPATNAYDIPPDKQEEFNGKYAALLDEDKQIVARPIKLTDLGNAEFSAGFFLQLDWLISDK